MQELLHDLDKDKLISIIQDYQEMVSELEVLANNYNNIKNYEVGDGIREIIYKERNGD